jgi:ribosomal protein S18 acetylase RimI-like enzyme
MPCTRTPEESAAAAAPPTHCALSVRTLRDSDAYDHDLVRRLTGMVPSPMARRHLTLPSLPPDCGPPNDDTIVACVDGLVVGRGILEATHPPYCELVNMGVRPDYRRRGIASALVREAQRRARAAGFKYMALQTELDNLAAHRLYESLGFVSAARGEMLRMLAVLDAPALNLHRMAHPTSRPSCRSDEALGTGWWRLEWRDGEEFVALVMFGGSCQGDSGGLLPTVRAFELREDDLHIAALVESADTVGAWAPSGGPIEAAGTEVRVTVRNLGKRPFAGAVRGVLLPGLEVPGYEGAELPEVSVAPGGSAIRAFRVSVQPSFRRDALLYASYPSIPLTAELSWDGGSVLLSSAAKVA